ncbi:MAG TPA: alpha/beta hydrolase-fold protein [Gaiellaceae bacterium]|nr:alpha/beta hydrolase-fold protein [Gaiellaceae bacterium]
MKLTKNTLRRFSEWRIVVALVVACGTATAAWATTQHAERGVDEQIESYALGGTAHALVVLPPGYSTSRLRYPVVYFLHGLPAAGSAYRANGWVGDALLDAGPAILVVPQASRDTDTDPEYLNWGRGREWETFVAEELPHWVDAHFRTIPARRGRALVGVSAGGYGATILGLHHLGSFAVIESWSGYFHPTDPSGILALPRGAITNVHLQIPALRSDERVRPTFFAFYVGGGDDRFRPENVRLNRELTAAHVPHVFAIYRGGHTTSLWEAHAAAWLTMALRHLAAPQR